MKTKYYIFQIRVLLTELDETDKKFILQIYTLLKQHMRKKGKGGI